MRKLAKQFGMVAAVLSVATAAWAGEKLLSFKGSVASLGGSSSHNVPMTAGHKYLITVRSQSKTASFDLDLALGNDGVAAKSANGARTTQLRFAPTKGGVYKLSVVAATEPGSYTGTVELDED